MLNGSERLFKAQGGRSDLACLEVWLGRRGFAALLILVIRSAGDVGDVMAGIEVVERRVLRDCSVDGHRGLQIGVALLRCPGTHHRLDLRIDLPVFLDERHGSVDAFYLTGGAGLEGCVVEPPNLSGVHHPVVIRDRHGPKHLLERRTKLFPKRLAWGETGGGGTRRHIASTCGEGCATRGRRGARGGRNRGHRGRGSPMPRISHTALRANMVRPAWRDA